jgi:hypothetical protein
MEIKLEAYKQKLREAKEDFDIYSEAYPKEWENVTYDTVIQYKIKDKNGFVEIFFLGQNFISQRIRYYG